MLLSTRKICLVNCFLIGFSGLAPQETDIFSFPLRFKPSSFSIFRYFLLFVLLMETAVRAFREEERRNKKIYTSLFDERKEQLSFFFSRINTKLSTCLTYLQLIYCYFVSAINTYVDISIPNDQFHRNFQRNYLPVY